MYKIVYKPWGKEEWLALNDFYCYKRIYINSGYKTSYQYHEFKHETNYIIEGVAEVWLENDEGIVEKKIMKEGEFFNVTPPKKHRVIALTDIILQEVSTPHVDDVFRINDEFNRADGKINSEHSTPAVLILAAGLGSRLKDLTKEVNKAMLPIDNKAIISHIIDKFPIEYDFIIALGYKGESLKQYCKLAHPKHKFTFIDIDDYESENSGPGYSANKCREYLQRPFYFIVADCIVDYKIPHLDGNWLGVHPTSYPEKYATLNVDKNNNIINFANKNVDGYDNAFIGLASIWDYEVFWKALGHSKEIVEAFINPSIYKNFKAKQLKWIDTGNLDDLEKAKIYYKDEPLSLSKSNGEITYKTKDTFIKFTPSKKINKNRKERAQKLKNLIPSHFESTENFISYNWESGYTLYENDSLKLYKDFLKQLKTNIDISEKYFGDKILFDNFYKIKTEDRINKFIEKYDIKYYKQKYTINGKLHDSLENIISKLDVSYFYDNMIYSLFHGDLQFDNIIYNSSQNKFVYIDWRESFSDSTKGGDIYYDLAKLYGGSIIPYNMVKNEDNIELEEGLSVINYSCSTNKNLLHFKNYYEKWIIDNGFNLNKIKLISGIIFLNMSPLHEEKLSKMLWFKSIEILNEFYK